MLKKNYKNIKVRNAIFIGTLSTLSYLACYFCRNILSVVSPEMIKSTDITVEFIGTLSTFNMLCYAGGQLMNGIVGDRLKAKYLVSVGLILSGICSLFVPFSDFPMVMIGAYSLIGFFSPHALCTACKADC